MNKKRIITCLVAGAIAVGGAVGIAMPASATTENVGGGTWNYGTQFVFPIYKNVYSQYQNNTYYHSATSIGGSATQKIYANAHNWANSGVQCGASEGTAAYWANY